MPKYDENEQQIIFSAEESAEYVCPICGRDIDYGSPETHEGYMVCPWVCLSCAAEGKEYGMITFDGHNVNFMTLPVDMQVEYAGVRVLCVNRSLKVGDLILSAPDNTAVPCLPGRITAIDKLGSKAHTSGNQTDDVHVDFTGDYGERRKREIVEEDARLRGYAVPFDEVRLDDIIMAPSELIGISEIEDEELRRVMESEENALRHAYKCLRMLL